MTAPWVDVAVIGGGPAGAATALRLARDGASVQLYERSHYDRPRMGETLPPTVNPLLRDLDVWDRFAALGSVPSHQTASAWGGTEVAERSFMFSPYGNGWHADRAAFDEMLVMAAADAGAAVERGASVRAVRRLEPMTPTVSSGFAVDGTVAVRADWVIDATGRSARIALSLGAKREQLDRLVSVAKIFTLPSRVAVDDTFIEATPDGWWYVSPLPHGQRLVACFTDAGLAAASALTDEISWGAALARTTHTAAMACGRAEPGVRVASAASHRLTPCTGARWLAVGDAALAVDPLSSSGVSFALRSAALAVAVVSGGNPADYRAAIEAERASYQQLRDQIYGWEARFAGNPFWNQRAS